jgi:hypothetical protein
MMRTEICAILAGTGVDSGSPVVESGSLGRSIIFSLKGSLNEKEGCLSRKKITPCYPGGKGFGNETSLPDTYAVTENGNYFFNQMFILFKNKNERSPS